MKTFLRFVRYWILFNKRAKEGKYWKRSGSRLYPTKAHEEIGVYYKRLKWQRPFYFKVDRLLWKLYFLQSKARRALKRWRN